jgi:enoyl-CoA hydratase
MQPDELLYTVDGAIARLTINRPDRRNAVSYDVLRLIERRLDEAARDPAVRVVVLTGTGEKAFSAGADLSAAQGGGAYAMHEARGFFSEIIRKLDRLPKPTVARVNGAALGGGFGLALACDVTIASETATFGTPEVDLGLFPMMIMPLIFRHANHRKRALEMVLTGEKLPAAQAQALGFATRVVPAADLDAAVAETCAKLAGKSPVVLRLGREAYRRMQEMPFDAALDYLKCMLTIDTLTEDAAEGITAFLEKRPAVWKGI